MTDPSAAAPRPDAASRVCDAREPAPLVLGEVVAALVRPTTHTVVVETRSAADGSLLLDREEVTVRPVLDELRESLVPGGESGGSGRGGHVALAVDVADVLRDLELLVRAGLTTCRLRRRRTPRVDPLADALSQLVPHPWPTAGARQAFTDRLAEHVERGRAVLAGETTGTYVRDTRCPTCKAEWVTEQGAGGWDRHPALRVNRGRPDPDGTPGPILGTSCTRCHRRWTWADMQAPTAAEPGGKLWQAITADRAAVMAERTRHAAAGRAAELEQRRRLYGTDPERTSA